MVETSAVPHKNPASSSRTIDGQAVIALSDQAQIHILNDVGTRVWNLIDGQRTFTDIVAQVQKQLSESGYEGLPGDLSADVEDFLEEITSKDMITMGEADKQERG